MIEIINIIFLLRNQIQAHFHIIFFHCIKEHIGTFSFKWLGRKNPLVL